MKQMKNLIVSLSLLVMAAGCTGLAGPPAHLYSMTPLQGEGQVQMQTSPVIVIEELTAHRALNTDRMPIRTAGQEIQYLAGSKFADRIPALLQSVTAQSIENVAGYPAISGQVSGLYAQYLLRGAIRKFEVDTTAADGAVVQIDLGIRVVDFATSRLLGVKHFKVSVPVSSMTAADVSAAFDRATGQALTEIVGWLDSQIKVEQAAKANLD